MEIKEITFSYDNKSSLLKSVSSEIKREKITTIIGPNGSGKSTLLGVMANNYFPQSGHVVLDGKLLSQYKPKELAKKLAVVHQTNEAPADMTVEKLIAYGRLPYKRLLAKNEEEDEKAIEWALACTNLVAKRLHTLKQLSGGERQRVWIAMSLAQRTPIIFLDEPTTYLDIYYQFEILELIKKLNEDYGLTIVMVLHDINQAIRYSDYIIVMKNGEVVLECTPIEVITTEMVKSIYGVEVVVKEDEVTGLYIVPLGL